MGIWVAELRVSDTTRHKLASVHNLDLEVVRDALVCVEGLPYYWDNDRDRGLRAIVDTYVNGIFVKVVLYPVGDDVWRLGSAYPIR